MSGLKSRGRLTGVQNNRDSCIDPLQERARGDRMQGLERQISPLQFTVTWYRIHHTGEQVAHWDIQNKATSSSHTIIFFVLDVPVLSLLSSMADFYHVTVSCKGPIQVLGAPRGCVYVDLRLLCKF